MTTTDDHCHHPPIDWANIGRAAERFARRVADDARHFAERVEQSAGDFARDVRRDWTATEGTEARDDIRRIFDDVRGIVRGVLDGVDELVSGAFRNDPGARWSKVVLNRDATCAACGRSVASGTEAFVRQEDGGMHARCAECGPAPG